MINLKISSWLLYLIPSIDWLIDLLTKIIPGQLFSFPVTSGIEEYPIASKFGFPKIKATEMGMAVGEEMIGISRSVRERNELSVATFVRLLQGSRPHNELAPEWGSSKRIDDTVEIRCDFETGEEGAGFASCLPEVGSLAETCTGWTVRMACGCTAGLTGTDIFGRGSIPANAAQEEELPVIKKTKTHRFSQHRNQSIDRSINQSNTIRSIYNKCPYLACSALIFRFQGLIWAPRSRRQKCRVRFSQQASL